jgi:isopropylmalate/homocitrate/citramalate synthase/2-oxo-4-hydroxy-4-carboxy--5-ureidoimidazoline (OHCU) decarboxylase
MLNPDHIPSREGYLNISDANFWPETRKSTTFPDKVRILDSTLRKTYFTAGNVTSPAGFVRIAEALVELGVTDTCVNVTWAGDTSATPQDWAMMQAVLSADLPLRVNVWSDILLGNGRDPQPIRPDEGMRRLVDAGATIIAPGIVPAPDAEAEKRQMEQLDEHLQQARELGVTTTITLAQVGLRDFDQLVRTSRHAVEGGATRLDLMDSTSSLSPEAMHVFLRKFRSAMPEGTAISMHAHDEFGLATATTLAAVAEGAIPDVSMNGMSYRCGFAALEQVVLALETLYGTDTGLRLDRIAHVSDVVARESGLPVPQLRPITGSYANLKHMPGDAEAAIRAGDDASAAFPPISHGLVPARIGSEVTWVWGAASSIGETDALAASEGLTLTPDERTVVRNELDGAVAALSRYPRWLAPQEARSILQRTLQSLRAGKGPRGITALGDAVTESVPDTRTADALIAAFTTDQATNRYSAVPAPATVEKTVGSVVDGLSVGSLIDLVNTFNRLGETPVASDPGAELSTIEESAVTASSDQDRTNLAQAAARYETRFGFAPVVAASGMDAAAVTAVLQDAVATASGVDELNRTRTAVCTILATRINRYHASQE